MTPLAQAILYYIKGPRRPGDLGRAAQRFNVNYTELRAAVAKVLSGS